jgi:AbrB family looped-hinge helix DNA binding protein
MRKLLGTSKVSTDNKITIVKDAAKILGISQGDILAFYEEDGKILIEKG